MSNANDPLIGLAVTGSYVIRTKLAEGGMGAVYVAVNQLGNKKVVKFLLGEFTNHPVIRDRFDREARAAARLKGKPHIVEIDDVGMLPNGQQFMTMEFLHGRPLDVHLRQSGRVTPHHAFHIVVQIGRGLHELHTAGVIHRDLKPGNVFLRSDDDDPYHVVLIDLGIAHDSVVVHPDPSARTQTGMAMGTPGYMAPEQFDDAGAVTPAADIYALAGILWEMLCGAPPWGFADPRVLYFKQRTETPEFPPGVVMPDAWRATLLAALAPKAEQRPQTVYSFLAALASALPAEERLGIPGGAQMMSRFAKSMLKNAAPDSETVRAQGAERVALMMWTPEGGTSPSAQPHSVNMSGVPAAVPTPLIAPTANGRGGAAAYAPSQPTTLSASSGVAVSAAAPRRRSAAAGFAVIGLVLAAGLTAFIMRQGSRESSDVRSTDAASIVPASTPGASSQAAGAISTVDAGVAQAALPAPDALDAGVAHAALSGPDASLAVVSSAPVDAGVTLDASVPPTASAQIKKPKPTPPPGTKPRTDRRDRAPATPQSSGAAFDPNAVEE